MLIYRPRQSTDKVVGIVKERAGGTRRRHGAQQTKTPFIREDKANSKTLKLEAKTKTN